MQHPNTQARFALCIRNTGAEDLDLRKAYRILPTNSPQEDGYLRVIDESGEDYLYPADYFVVLELSPVAEQALLLAP